MAPIIILIITLTGRDIMMDITTHIIMPTITITEKLMLHLAEDIIHQAEQIHPPGMLLQPAVRFILPQEVQHTELPMQMQQEGILRTATDRHLLVLQLLQAELTIVVQLLQQETFRAEHILDLAVEIQVEVLHIQGLHEATAAVQVLQEVLQQLHGPQHREEIQHLRTGHIQDPALRTTIRIQGLRILNLQGLILHPRTEQTALLRREVILLRQTIQLPAEQQVLHGPRGLHTVLPVRLVHRARQDHQDLLIVVLHVLHQAAATLLHQEAVQAQAQVQGHHHVPALLHREAAAHDQVEDNQKKYPACFAKNLATYAGPYSETLKS
jgi:hypothetical protein